MVSIRLLFLSVFVAAILIGSGCAHDKRRDGRASAAYADPSTWMSAAETHQRRGDLQQALFEYRVARTLVKQDTDIDNAIRRLEKHITEQTEQLTKRGKGAMRQGKTSKAGRLYLETLSLDPNHKDALAALRKLDEESSKRAMERKVALSKRNGTGRGRRQKKGLQGYEEEAYTYSRQAILQTENGPGNVREFIKELEKHIQKYPHDLALRRLLSKTHVKQAKKTYQAEKYDRTLNYLEKAERAVNGDKTKINAIARVRKEFAKALYIKGVRSSREEPEQALRYWKQALKFDPEDKRIRLRIQNMQRM